MYTKCYSMFQYEMSTNTNASKHVKFDSSHVSPNVSFCFFKVITFNSYTKFQSPDPIFEGIFIGFNVYLKDTGILQNQGV